MREHLAVEEYVMADGRRVFCELRKSARGFLQVTREQLDTIALQVKLAPNSIIFLLRPHAGRAHSLESLRGRFHGAGEHEAHRLKQGDGCGVELFATAAHGRFAYVTGDEVNAFDQRDG